MNRQIRVIVLCDADPDRPDYGGTRFDDPGPLVWRGLTDGVPPLIESLQRLRDNEGNQLPIIWCWRADGQIERCHGDSAWALKSMSDLTNTIAEAGHLLGWHPHHWRWSDQKSCWFQETRDQDWQRKNLRKGAAAFDKLPSFSRTGWYAMDETTMSELDALGVKGEFSAMPGLFHRGGKDDRGSFFLGYYDWARCRQTPYRPHLSDYQAHDPRPEGIIEFPCTTIESSAIRTLYKIRYKLRGADAGVIGLRTSINITAHPLLFGSMISRVIHKAKSGKNADLIAYFHPDELLGIGPKVAGRPIYHRDHLVENLENLISSATACTYSTVGKW